MTDDRLTPYETLVSFLYQAPIGLLELTGDGIVTMANPEAAKLLLPLVANGNLDNLFDALLALAPDLRNQVAALARDAAGEGLALRLTQDGRRTILLLRLTRLDEQRLMASVSDITAAEELERARIAARVHDVQRIDQLTCLPNRQAVLEVLRERLAHSRSQPGALEGLALFLIDLDRFERVNTRLGAGAGDLVLRQIAERLREYVRMLPAGIAARLGSDEFIVVLGGLHERDDATRAASQMLDIVSGPCEVDDQTVNISASIGVHIGMNMRPGAESALHDAALAMREAKNKGGGCQAMFCPDTHGRALRRARTEHELREAISKRELFVVYQPIVPLVPGERVGFEALVRWRHPTRGLVSPDEFIGIAESSGLIEAVGAYVLGEACAQFVAWQRTFGPLAMSKMSINVSRGQLQSTDFEARVHAILDRTGMAPNRLQLEITESLAAQDDQIRETLRRLKSARVQIALDDFGTGYSSLASLHQLPVDVLKIDRAFVRQLESSRHHRVLVEATLMVAQSLGLGTVAEGVETLEQAQILRRLTCTSAQGYLFARPLTAEAAGQWFLAHGAVDRGFRHTDGHSVSLENL
ncbi:MAG: bifunctional diguanylate cyclase/phosphodiesterase [Hyphomicrobiales bacterium]|nr:MAG: bifunctional diguanylate cyclase/phosphodiesterase [Hyphomicrobiales bacterium]